MLLRNSKQIFEFITSTYYQKFGSNSDKADALCSNSLVEIGKRGNRSVVPPSYRVAFAQTS